MHKLKENYMDNKRSVNGNKKLSNGLWLRSKFGPELPGRKDEKRNMMGFLVPWNEVFGEGKCFSLGTKFLGKIYHLGLYIKDTGKQKSNTQGQVPRVLCSQETPRRTVDFAVLVSVFPTRLGLCADTNLVCLADGWASARQMSLNVLGEFNR